MLITGTVTAVGMPHGSDKWGNSYQWITVNTPAGPITGQKASKEQLTQNFVGQQVEWECENGTGPDGQPCNKFKRPKQQFNQTPPQQPQQGYQQPAGAANNKDMLICSQVVYKGLIELEKEGKLARAEFDTRLPRDLYLLMNAKPMPPSSYTQREPGEDPDDPAF